MVEFIERYARNLGIVALGVAVLWGLLTLFYPAAIDRFIGMELFIGGLHLWPALLVLVLLLALPLRKP